MPGRKVPLVTGEYYHVFNRGVARMRTFFEPSDYERFISLVRYYQNIKPPYKYSFLARMGNEKFERVIVKIRESKDFLVKIYTFKLMPNHFHLILEQLVDGGISQFMSQLENSYTRYINTKNKRPGPLFQGKFKAVLIETPEQLIHLSRYQHLNALTSRVVSTFEELLDYQYSSLPNYLGRSIYDFIETNLVLSDFKNKEQYEKFLRNHTDYQQRLHVIKKLLIEA